MHICLIIFVTGFEFRRYVHENGCTWGRASTSAALKGHLKCLKYAHENGSNMDHTCSAAACGGKLECLKYVTIVNSSLFSLYHYRYAHENGCRWDSYECADAAAIGSLECLKYAHENGCPWDEKTCVEAAKNLRMDCLRYGVLPPPISLTIFEICIFKWVPMGCL
jgi:hypothetical protein